MNPRRVFAIAAFVQTLESRRPRRSIARHSGLCHGDFDSLGGDLIY
jgi:hypothetical protein